MKKLFLAAGAAAVMLLVASCASKTQNQGTEIASKIENCTNTDSIKVYVEQAKDYAAKLVSEGKTEEAKNSLKKSNRL